MNAGDVRAQLAGFAPAEDQVEEPITSAEQVKTTDPNQMMSGLMKLLEILSQREARLEMQERAVIEAAAKRDEQIRKSNKDWDRNRLATQARCNHRKGYTKTFKSPAPLTVDFAVYMHTFINLKREIKCRICKMTWRPEDTKDFLFIQGLKIHNHTGIVWSDAVTGKLSATAMTEQSTDKPSASEAPLVGQLPEEVTSLLQGREPEWIAKLLQSPEAKAFLERTAAGK